MKAAGYNVASQTPATWKETKDPLKELTNSAQPTQIITGSSNVSSKKSTKKGKKKYGLAMVLFYWGALDDSKSARNTKIFQDRALKLWPTTEYSSHFEAFKVDCSKLDKREWKKLAKKWRFKRVPTLVFARTDGKVLGKIDNYKMGSVRVGATMARYIRRYKGVDMKKRAKAEKMLVSAHTHYQKGNYRQAMRALQRALGCKDKAYDKQIRQKMKEYSSRSF